MSKVNTDRARYFNDWPLKETGYFTSDNLAFFEESHANNHAGNLPVKTVDCLTRADFNEWMAEQGGNDGAVSGGTLDVEVTQDVLNMNPELAEMNVAIGDVIQIPVDETQNTPEEIKADVAAGVGKYKAAKSKLKADAVAGAAAEVITADQKEVLKAVKGVKKKAVAPKK